MARVVFDDEKSSRRFHPASARSNERLLVVDIVQRVRHQDAIESGEWPWLFREVATVRCDVHALVRRRDASQSRAVEIHRVNGAARRQQIGERDRERAVSTTKVGPGRWPQRVDAAIGEHVNRIARPHPT
jgi:hypothetical protein